MTGPSDKRTAGGRQRTLEAASSLINENGLAGTSLQMIANRLGVSKPALYHHFRSRDDIVANLMEPVITDVEEALALLNTLSVGQRSLAAREFYRDFTIKHRQIINLVFFDRGALDADTAVLIDHLADAVAKAMSEDEQEETVAGNLATVYGVAALVTRSTQLSDDALQRLLSSVLRTEDRIPE